MIDYNALWHSVLTLEINLNHIYQSQTPMSPRLHRLDLTSDHTISLISPYKSVNTLVSSKLSNSQFDILLSSSEILSGKSSSILASLFSSFITSPSIMGGMGALWFVSSDCYNQINTSERNEKNKPCNRQSFSGGQCYKEWTHVSTRASRQMFGERNSPPTVMQGSAFCLTVYFLSKNVSRLR